MSLRTFVATLAVSVTSLGGASAQAGERALASASASADLYVAFVLNGAPISTGASGRTYTVEQTPFRVGLQLLSNGPDAATASVRLHLPAGLRLTAPPPDAACTGDSTVVCNTPQAIPPPPPAFTGFEWRLGSVAATTGAHAFRVEVASSSATDPDSANNAMTVNVVVRPGGGAAGVRAGMPLVTPARPAAGGIVVATVRVSTNGAPVRPSRVVCTARIGALRVRGTARARRGSASCTFRTPATASGRTLVGTVVLVVRGERFTRTFRKRLG